MNTTQSNQKSDAIHQVYDQFSNVLRRQAEQIENLHQSVKKLQTEQRQLEDAASHLVEPLERSLASDDVKVALSPAALLACMRRFGATTHVGQLLEVLAEEAARRGVRAAVFEVRGRAAWGSLASGFEPELDAGSLQALVIPLNQEGPFHRAYETAETVEARPADFEKEGRVLAKLRPSSNATILLVPIRSAGFVVAVLYAEMGERRDLRLIDSLQVLAEIAGAQVDRLMLANGGIATVEPALAKAERVRGPELEGEAVAPEPEAGAATDIPGVVTPEPDLSTVSGPPPEVAQASMSSPATSEAAAEIATAPETVQVTLSAEEGERIHRDARRFSKLLVSEIELYNKGGVEEGRRNGDLYLRLKKDIDRSRETYEKRFAHTVAKQFDYFHEELVKTLAANDPTLLGSGYPGPTV